MNVKEKMRFAYSLYLAIVKGKRYLHCPSRSGQWINSALRWPRQGCSRVENLGH